MEIDAMLKMRFLAAAVVALATFSAGCGTTPPTPAQAAAKESAQGPADLRYSNKWRIEVSEGANSDGEFVFHVTPKGGQTQVVTIQVDDGQSENHVARTIRNGFEKQLDSREYHVEVDDGEDVLVKKKMNASVFALEIVSSTVKSVRLHLQKE